MLACGLVSADTTRMKQEVSSKDVHLWVTLGKSYVTAVEVLSVWENSVLKVFSTLSPKLTSDLVISS
ncbi:MAG: hypothetical protein EBE86_023545 [Hormoscilla sp. GUM202]|nr:hypothetical protein [Hormoscilla sp. GUM202]